MPLVVMEPNAIPGLANRKVAGRVYRALLGFESAKGWFPPAKSEFTGLPVRREFFPCSAEDRRTIHSVGDRRKSRRPQIQSSRASCLAAVSFDSRIQVIHQTGANEYDGSSPTTLPSSGVKGEIMPFIQNMAEMFTRADLVFGRAGAGGVNEIAAAGMPSILVPLPTAADDHQRENAEALVIVNAARMIADSELAAESLFTLEVETLRSNSSLLAEMRQNVKAFRASRRCRTRRRCS